MKRGRTSGPMCVISIGYGDFVLPLKDGMRVIELLQGAAQVELDFVSHQRRYKVQEEPIRTGLVTVTPNQIVMPQSDAERPPRKRSRPALPHLSSGLWPDED